jgi:hypothetical protein
MENQMKFFNMLKALSAGMSLLLGFSTAYAQIPTFTKTTDTISIDPSIPQFYSDLNNDSRADLVTLSPTGYSDTSKYAQLKISVRLNNADGTFGPAKETVLPLVSMLNRLNGAVYTSAAFRPAKLTPGSSNLGFIFTGVGSAEGLNLIDPNLTVDLANTVTLKGNGDGTFATPAITRALLFGGIPADLTGAGYHAQLVYSMNPNTGDNTGYQVIPPENQRVLK